MPRFCLALDLKDDPALIDQYVAHHRAVWPEVLASIRESGIISMEIYRIHLRLIMIIETESHFSLDRKAAMDLANPMVQRWESLMSNFQQSLPGSAPGEKWRRADLVFSLSE